MGDLHGVSTAESTDAATTHPDAAQLAMQMPDLQAGCVCCLRVLCVAVCVCGGGVSAAEGSTARGVKGIYLHPAEEHHAAHAVTCAYAMLGLLQLAHELALTCHEIYRRTPTGLAPEIVWFRDRGQEVGEGAYPKAHTEDVGHGDFFIKRAVRKGGGGGQAQTRSTGRGHVLAWAASRGPQP